MPSLDELIEFVTGSPLTPYVLVDGEGLVVAASPAALADLGLVPDHAQRQPAAVVVGAGPTTLAELADDPTRLHLMHPPSGPMRLRAHRVPDALGQPGFLVELQTKVGGDPSPGQTDELTERTQRLEVLLADLSERYEELNRFAGLISHDLQAPTRRLLSFVQILRSDLPSSSGDVQSNLDAIERSATHLLTLTSELLAYARLGRRPMTLEPVDAQRVFDHIVEMLEVKLHDTHASVRVDGEQLPVVHASATFLGVVFQNLIENAVKYSRGGVDPEVVFTAHPAGDHVRLDVTDNGIGIPADVWAVVFEPFRRLHPRDENHTGVGLASARRILERFDGSLSVSESEEGSGSTFSLVLRRP